MVQPLPFVNAKASRMGKFEAIPYLQCTCSEVPVIVTHRRHFAWIACPKAFELAQNYSSEIYNSENCT